MITALMIAAAFPAFAADYSGYVERPYSVLAERLAGDGWKPGSRTDYCDTFSETCDELPGVIRCTASSIFRCRIEWTRDGEKLIVSIVGEDNYKIEAVQ
jgi:hypothetical protein